MMKRVEKKPTMERVAEPAPALAWRQCQIGIISYCDSDDKNTRIDSPLTDTVLSGLPFKILKLVR